MENKRLTLNGLDGFLSGGWTLKPQHKVIDDKTMVLNAAKNFDTSRHVRKLIFPPDSVVTFSLGEKSTSGAYLQLTPSDGSPVIVYGGQSRTFKTTANTKDVIADLSNNEGIKEYVFDEPMIVLGSTPIPYEPKKGSVMVEPVPVKNLFDDSFSFKNWATLQTTNTVLNDGSLKIDSSNYSTPRSMSPYFKKEWAGKTVTISVDVLSVSNNQTYRLSVYNMTKSIYINQENKYGVGRKNITVNLPINLDNISFWIHPTNNGYIDPNVSVVVKNIQLEESSISTPYEPYKVQLNKHAKRNLPNLR